MNPKNKKAELTTTEIVKIILAVIGIGILLYLTISLYGIFFGEDKDVKQAKANLKSIADTINNLEEGKINSYMVVGPKGWFVVFFSKTEELPASCLGKNCICFCKGKSNIDELQLKSCEEVGICNGFTEDIEFITKTLDNNIDLSLIPREVYLKKEGSVVKIYTEEQQEEPIGELNDFLNNLISVEIDGAIQNLKTSEVMIRIVETEDSGGLDQQLFGETKNLLDQFYGKNKWAMRYSKEGPGYKWIYMNRERWEATIAGEDGNLKTSVSDKVPYDKGVLKVEMRVLK